jgi:hypothetical protein
LVTGSGTIRCAAGRCCIFTVGLPEELAKALPVLAIVLIYRGSRDLTPRDYLFLGAVSGLVFGASEVVHYFTVNGVAEFYLTVQSASPSIEQLISTGHSASTSLFADGDHRHRCGRIDDRRDQAHLISIRPM